MFSPKTSKSLSENFLRGVILADFTQALRSGRMPLLIYAEIRLFFPIARRCWTIVKRSINESDYKILYLSAPVSTSLLTTPYI
jgi:hypothetical protein